MRDAPKFEIFLSAPPGLELALKAEALERGFKKAKAVPGGVSFRGKWPDVWRANLELRGAGRVLVRLGGFRATHFSALDHGARSFDWARVLHPDVPVKVEVSCKGSKLYHERAVAERVERALLEEFGVQIRSDNALKLMVRIEADEVVFSVDTSGDLLHKRGYKEAVGKAPMRETLAALLLRQCGYSGCEPVLDPMCGSGTFPIEAAEIAAGLMPGRARTFAFEQLVGFDQVAWNALRQRPPISLPDLQFYGSDRDAGAIRSAIANAERAGVAALTRFDCHSVSDTLRPDRQPGLVMINPPYGGRIGDKKQLFGLYASLGKTLAERFSGWRVGLVTTDAGLARATNLPFGPPGPPVSHGGLKINLWQTKALR